MPRGIPSSGPPNRMYRVKGGDRTIDDPRYKMYHNAKHRAKRKGIEFTITMEEIDIPSHCPLLGIELDSWTGHKNHPANPSLDQKEPGKGYTPENTWVISSRANWLKADGTLDEFRMLVENWSSI